MLQVIMLFPLCNATAAGNASVAGNGQSAHWQNYYCWFSIRNYKKIIISRLREWRREGGMRENYFSITISENVDKKGK